MQRDDGPGGDDITTRVEDERRKHAGCADLVLAGGGVKGIAHVGAVRALEERGYDCFQRVVGTSVGALVGALVAAGVPGAEIEGHIRSFDFRRLRDRGLIDRIPLIGKPLSIGRELGVYEGDEVRDWLHGVLVSLEAETFGKLKARAAARPRNGLRPGESPLMVLATDITRGRLVRLPGDYGEYELAEDDEAVADAVRASLSIPVFFEPLRLGTSILVDGGVLSNYPITTFDRNDPSQARWPTFGMTLLGPKESTQLGREAIGSIFPALKLVPGPLATFAAALTGTLVVGQDQHQLERPGVRERTIQIDANAFGVVDFGIQDGGKGQLIERGREAAGAFMDGWQGVDGRRGSGRFPVPGRP